MSRMSVNPGDPHPVPTGSLVPIVLVELGLDYCNAGTSRPMLSLSHFKICQQPSPQQPNPMLLRPRAMSLSGTVGNLGMMVDTTAGVIGQGYTQQSQPTQKNSNSTPPRFFFSRRSKAQAKKSTFSPFWGFRWRAG